MESRPSASPFGSPGHSLSASPSTRRRSPASPSPDAKPASCLHEDSRNRRTSTAFNVTFTDVAPRRDVLVYPSPAHVLARKPSLASVRQEDVPPTADSLVAEMTFGDLQRWLVKLQATGEGLGERITSLQAAHEVRRGSVHS